MSRTAKSAVIYARLGCHYEGRFLVQLDSVGGMLCIRCPVCHGLQAASRSRIFGDSFGRFNPNDCDCLNKLGLAFYGC